jgi:membrane protein required for colicin V production
MNTLDIFVLSIVILSGLFAFARGFVKECLSIVSWTGAAIAALYATPYLSPFAAKYVPSGAVVPAAAATAFLVTLIVLTIVTGAIARVVRRSSLSALDRTLGLIFGLMRGALLVGIGFMALSFALPANGSRPDWLKDSKTAPLFAEATAELSHLVPEPFRARAAQLNPQQKIESQFENAMRAYTLPKPAGGPGATISPEEQQRLDELFKRFGGTPPADPPEHVIEVGPPASPAPRQ